MARSGFWKGELCRVIRAGWKRDMVGWRLLGEVLE